MNIKCLLAKSLIIWISLLKTLSEILMLAIDVGSLLKACMYKKN